MAINLFEAYESFIFDRESYCVDASVKNYRNTLRYFIDYICERKKLPAEQIEVSDIELQDLKSYSIYLKNKKKNDNHPYLKDESNPNISSRTRNDYLKDCKAFFNFLIQEEKLEKDPSANLKLPKVDKQPIEPLTEDEGYIIDDCYNINTVMGCRNLAIIHCLLDEGMRPGEVQRLKLSDLHFDSDYIVIRNSKWHKSRILPMARITKKYLSRYVSDKRPDVSHEYVFCTDTGEKLTPNSIKCVFDRLKKKSGISRLYPYMLRHTFGTSFILGGGSLEFLRIYMGHEDIQTTQNYLHVANNFRFCKNIYKLDKCFIKQTY